MIVDSLTDIGLVRKANEDNFLVKEEIGLFVVADGMGGHKGGQLASSLAIQTIEEFLTVAQAADNQGDKLCQALQAANKRIFEEAANTDNVGMGTTVTAAQIDDFKAYIAHIGDSRAYLIRNKEIRLVTSDHSLVGELMRCGELSEEDALTHPHRNILTRALGTQSEVEVDLLELDLETDDKLLLCTDGLSNLVEKEEMLKIVLSYNLKEAVNKLVQMALERGGTDNITVIIVDYEG